ncbi:hypothetical protein LCGC14_0392080 [marine sediment metagenome]|uniref:Uncharacterized protein n=1 Tax=marine sediment metagenome TaxID=412755 RepID=A0A0F9T551_9ZZZZ
MNKKKKPSKLTQKERAERHEQMVKLVGSGIPVAQVASHYNVNTQTVRNACAKAGVDLDNRGRQLRWVICPSCDSRVTAVRAKSGIELETFKRFVAGACIYVYLYSYLPARSKQRHYVFVWFQPETVFNNIDVVKESELTAFLKETGLETHDIQQIKYELTGSFKA